MGICSSKIRGAAEPMEARIRPPWYWCRKASTSGCRASSSGRPRMASAITGSGEGTVSGWAAATASAPSCTMRLPLVASATASAKAGASSSA